jgi:hypothetical protein
VYMGSEADGDIVKDKIIFEDTDKFIQWRFTVNEFYEKHYVHLRKYYLNFEGEYVPSKEGACLPLSVEVVGALAGAFLSLMSDIEALEQLMEHLDAETISKILTGIENLG